MLNRPGVAVRVYSKSHKHHDAEAAMAEGFCSPCSLPVCPNKRLVVIAQRNENILSRVWGVSWVALGGDGSRCSRGGPCL